jgi:Transposase DDE domain
MVSHSAYNINMTNSSNHRAGKMDHTRAIIHDHTTRRSSYPDAPAVEAIFAKLFTDQPDRFANIFRAYGLRERELELPLMVALLLGLMWRQLPSVSEAVRELDLHGLYWQPPQHTTQQAVSQRLSVLPPAIFQLILEELLPQLAAKHDARTRPQQPVLRLAAQRFARVLIVDGSTLDSLWPKAQTPLHHKLGNFAGKVIAVLDAVRHLPVKVWYSPDSFSHDHNYWSLIHTQLATNDLILFDLGFVDYFNYAQLSREGIYFLTRAKCNTHYKVVQQLGSSATAHDYLVQLGRGESKCAQPMRLIEVKVGQQWYRYISNVLDPGVLSAEEIVGLYSCRWSIESAFGLVKRLLGMSYFYSESENAVQLEVWLSWLAYSIMVDLSDDVAEGLGLEYERISVVMVYRGLYHYARSYERDPSMELVNYLVEHSKVLGLVKQIRHKSNNAAPLSTLYLA